MMVWRSIAASAGFTLSLIASAAAQEAYLRVADVGPGLCVIAHTPDGYDMLFDAGHWQSNQCAAAVEEVVTDDHIELIIISHSDGDHLGELPEILARNTADTIIHTGSGPRDTDAWREAQRAIGDAAAAGSTVINLRNADDSDGDGISDEVGSVYELGDAEVTIVAGWHEWDTALSDADHIPEEAEQLNAISIVARFEYRGRSVLLTGDTIGRRIRDDPHACRDAERWMTTHAAATLRSDVLLAPHHGGDNGSSECFLAAVDPTFVIYSAGHQYRHPRQSAAQRAHAQGVAWSRMFRTDRGDDERDPDYTAPEDVEWGRGRMANNVDPRGDNTVEICLGASARVRYRSSTAWCGH